MVMFNFHNRFVSSIRAKTKRQTIRNMRKRNARTGDALQLYHGPRFHPKPIGFAACLSVGYVNLELANDLVRYWLTSGTAIHDCARELDAFAVLDGFDDWADMKAFWQETHDCADFEGWLTFWGDTFVDADEVVG